MSLNPGLRFGPYEILSAIGAGGMGEVYRARDTRLGREVAIKVLPAEFIAHAERRARFDREARLLASLNHPNIATIHGIEQVDGVQALVLELIEGETLRERLIRGPLALADAVRYAIAITDALDAAHEKGVVHRDLKPGNIKITPAGTVKVLDFGLAKVASDDRTGQDLTQSPTMTFDGTHNGTILGTAAYMSPEQARGQAVDKRADIWAFGCVLYEMLTGRQVFGGETLTDVLARILERAPNLEHLPSDTPSKILDLLRHCLQKDPRRRLHDIADARLELEDALSSPDAARSRIDGQKTRRRSIKWLTAGLVLGALGAGATVWVMRPMSLGDVEVMRFTIEPGPMPNAYALAISPDGRAVAFVARRSDGPIMLFVRSIGSVEARPLPGTEGAAPTTPFWSPDSRSLGFATASAPRQLKTIEVAEGRPRLVCDLLRGNPFDGTWNAGNVIVFHDGDNGALYRVPAAGGTPTLLAAPDRAAGETGYHFPQFLPDGRHFLYLARNTQPRNHAIFVASLDSEQSTRLMQSESMARYAPPHFLLYTRQQTLLAQQFDASTLTLTGQPIPIADGVSYRADLGRAAFAVSDAGILLYRTGGTDAGQRSLVWIDRSGRTGAPIAEPTPGGPIRLSPDGKRVAFSQRKNGAAEDIWIYDLQRNLQFRVTSNPAADHLPVWSPDGLRVGFDSHRGENRGTGLYETRADGATADQELLPPEPEMSYAIFDWTPEYILFSKGLLEGKADLWAQPLSGDRKPFRYLPGVTNAALSPNGRWLAYVANEGGVNQVIVQSFPDRSQRRQQISSKGGGFPRWRRDGRELFYLDSDWRLIAVPVDVEGTSAVEKSTALFAPPGSPFPPNTVGHRYDVTADGQRFLFSVVSGSLDSTTPITVVVNWTAGLKKRD